MIGIGCHVSSGSASHPSFGSDIFILGEFSAGLGHVLFGLFLSETYKLSALRFGKKDRRRIRISSTTIASLMFHHFNSHHIPSTSKIVVHLHVIC